MIWCGIVNGHVFLVCVFYLFIIIIRNKRVV
jgi:hypothetical protein